LILNIRDFFLPIPIPQEYESARENYLTSLFDYRWDFLGRQTNNKNIENSVKNMSILRSDFIKTIKNEIKPFTIRSQSAQEKDEYDVFIYLPPKYLLLIKIIVRSKETTAYIRTDFWKLISFIDDYFNNLVQQK